MAAKKSKGKKVSNKGKNVSKSKKVSNKSIKLSSGLKGAALKLGDIFSFSTKGTAKKNFSSSFEYQSFKVDLQGSVKNGKAKLNVGIDGKEFNFNGNITVSEKSFNDLCAVFDHLVTSVIDR